MKFKIVKSHLKNKKYDGIFEDGDSIHIVPFGATGYEDYTIHKDDKRKEAYIIRHHKEENWNDPMTSGALSRWILWNKKSLSASIKDFKKKFNLT